jgi:nitric oxide synthase oxygenase domain/subunit
MFTGILELLESSISSGATITRMAVFRSKRPGEVQGPRIWNNSILRYAGYEGEGGSPPETTNVLGDPSDAAFTTALISRFGWVPPMPRSKWDVLPLLLQIDETKPPQLFTLPTSYVPRVSIHHPEIPLLSKCNLQWFGIPVVSGMELSIGGLIFSAAPFVGWFADSEVVRDLTDSCRYNILPDVADTLLLDKNDDLWVDACLLAINRAVIHSFRESNLAMVTHHVSK